MPYVNLATQLQELRRRVNEPAAASISDNHIIDLLNHGAYIATRDMKLAFEDVYAFYTVAMQQQYNMPDGFITSSDLIYSPWVTHRPLIQTELGELLDPFPLTGDLPTYYALDKAKKTIDIAPIPETGAFSTTLNGALNATATTITLTAVSGLGQQGRIIVDSETIQYTNVSGYTITGCTRSVDGTTAATHLTGATVYWCDLFLYYQRRPKQLRTSYTTGTLSVTNGSATVTGVATNWLSGQNVYVGNYLGIGSYENTNAATTFPRNWYKISAISAVTTITLSSVFAEPSASTQNYIITDISELMEADTELPILFAEIEIYHKLGNADKKQLAREAYAYELVEAKKRLQGPDYLPTVRRTREAGDTGYPLPVLGGYYPDITM